MTLAVLALAAPLSASHASPVVVSPAEGAAVNARPLRIAGTAAGDAVAVRIVSGVTELAQTAVVGGNWSVDIALADGTHQIRASSRDASGTWSAPSTLRTFTVDTVAPAVPVITAPADGAIFGFATFAVEGTAQPGIRVSLTDAAGGIDHATADASGVWRVHKTWSGTIHTVTARSIDAAGNESLPSAAVRFTVDTLPPQPPRIDNPTQGAVTNLSTLTVYGGAEPGSTVTVYEAGARGSVVADGNGSWRMDLSFGAGLHQITARARDAAGNTSDPSPAVTFTVDLTPPPVPVIASPAQGAVVSPLNILVAGTSEPQSTVLLVRGETVIASVKTGNDGTWSTKLQNILNGTVNLRARARDAAGNLSDLSPVRTFYVDGVAPEVEVQTPTNSIFTPLNPPQIVGKATDNFGVRVVILDYYDLTGRGIASFVSRCGTCPATEVAWIATDTPLVGRFVVRAYALDVVNNRSDFAQFTVTIVRLP